MKNLIKLMVLLALVAFSVNASAYAYSDRGYRSDYASSHSMKRVSIDWKQQWSTKSYECGWLCKGGHHYPKYDKPSHQGVGDNAPEPGMVGLLAIGLLGMVIRRKLKA